MKLSNVARLAIAAVACGIGTLAVNSKVVAATLTPVDLELSLLVDVSGSVNNSEFNLQKQGYVDVFNSSDLFNNFISKGEFGKIAVNLIYWSSSGQQAESVGWTLIDSAISSQNFAAAINSTTRPFFGGTAPGSAIAYATPKFFNNAFDGKRQVIDVSGDGPENGGLNTATARNNALAQGVDAINGIVVGTNSERATTLPFYQSSVIGGTNADGTSAFVLEAKSFQEFGSVLEKKIKAEVKPPSVSVPEPASVIGLLAFSLIGASSVKQKFNQAKHN
ncbi:hypothetical protein DSM106972_007520 [Dulcicalothrix desertica PCC 7102]|uniref:VWFA domain-containing protein n=1 Tax=Dulcicalothrix desertica PCC 7102 TaxID=232991 RepID=A0A3S1AW84_9CYAN|nr:DUF1194 domain-containing protein [Dulcicalothrix desertica]RUT10257.1 hypothetical protein DSM106972_007520 [Dulcicalothrix desertica PCC 7102]TWH40767.1 putative secreted protein with PEP-CTERM sorting signal [Dulcicalothrix desertica PCC 7102]